MGRYAGWIALYSGLSGSADVILIPEIPFDIEKVCDKIRSREAAGRRFSIVVVAEGARPKRRGDRAGRAARRRHGGPARRDREQGGARDRAQHRQGDPHAGARPPPARRLADDLRPAPRAPVRRAPRCGRSPTVRSGSWSGSTARTSPGCRWPTSSAGPRTSRSTATSSRRRASWGSAWATDDHAPTYPAHPHLRRRRDPPRRDRSPIPTAGWRTARAPRPGDWTERAERAHRVVSRTPCPARERDPPPARRSCSRSARSACRRRCAGRYFYQRRDGRAEPAGALRARRRARRRPRRWSIPTRSIAAGTTALDWYYPERRRPAARLRPVGERQRAERAPGPGRGHRRDRCPTGSRTPAPPTSPGCPTAPASTTPAIPRPARSPDGRGALSPRHLLPPARDRPGRRSARLQAGREGALARA